jgi:hypothetical protein
MNFCSKNLRRCGSLWLVPTTGALTYVTYMFIPVNKLISWTSLYYFSLICLFIYFYFHRKVVIYGTLYWKDVIYGNYPGIYGSYPDIYGNYPDIYGISMVCTNVQNLVNWKISFKVLENCTIWCTIVPIKFWQGV